jgi:hypothetical protein
MNWRPKETDIVVPRSLTDAVPVEFRACAKFFEGCTMAQLSVWLDE